MKRYYDYIYLSPHLDDAALSCGGQIYQLTNAGRSVLIVNITAGDPPPGSTDSPFVHQQHSQWQLAGDVVTIRRREDAAAARILGADVLNWSLPDCIYRSHPETGRPLYLSDDEIFGPLDPTEEPLVAQLARQMDELPAHGQVLAPLCVGNHVDHQLTRAAGERRFGLLLAYYEDYPYAFQPLAVDQLLAQTPGNAACWKLTIVRLSEAAVAARIAAAGAYASQVRTLFGDEDAMARQIRERLAAVGGERVWQLARN